MVVLKDIHNQPTRCHIVNSNSDREIILGCHTVEAHCYGFLSRKVASCADVINNVNASILNIVQFNDDNRLNAIELEVKRAIATRVTCNEEI